MLGIGEDAKPLALRWLQKPQTFARVYVHICSGTTLPVRYEKSRVTDDKKWNLDLQDGDLTRSLCSGTRVFFVVFFYARGGSQPVYCGVFPAIPALLAAFLAETSNTFGVLC
jgi:hypothetical protein